MAPVPNKTSVSVDVKQHFNNKQSFFLSWCFNYVHKKNIWLIRDGRLEVLLKCCFTSTETVGLLGTGAQDGHLDFHTAPEL